MNFISYERLERTLLCNNPDADREILRKAFDFAREVHRTQVRDEGTPYFIHPYRVSLYLTQVMKVGDAKMVAVALLHDVIEDGDGITMESLAKIFGQDVAESVRLLSKDPLGRDGDRKVRDDEYYRRLDTAPKDVQMIKIADRLDNLRTLQLSPNPEKRRRYLLATRQHMLPMAKSLFPPAGEEMERLMLNREARHEGATG